MQTLGSIFLYNNNPQNQNVYLKNLENKGYFIFNTNNIYKFNLYSNEITPNILLFDFDKNTPCTLISSIERHFEHSNTPIIIVSESPKALIYHPAISHYLTHNEANIKLSEILESYQIGNKNHHVLYINLKPYERSDFIKSITDKNYSLFEVHNIKSAHLYLQKNKPSIICINFLPTINKFKKLFSHPKIFYVENSQNIGEIEQFIH